MTDKNETTGLDAFVTVVVTLVLLPIAAGFFWLFGNATLNQFGIDYSLPFTGVLCAFAAVRVLKAWIV